MTALILFDLAIAALLAWLYLGARQKRRDGKWHDSSGIKKQRLRPDGSWEYRDPTMQEIDERDARRDDFAW